MVAHNIFFIGATGHLGSSVLQALQGLNLGPQFPVTALVRDEKDKEGVHSIYPDAKIVITSGGLNDVEVVEAEASKASLVINVAHDIGFGPGIKAIMQGLASRKAHSFYIHSSGVALTYSDQCPTGEYQERVWDDVADIDEIQARPDTVTHGVENRIIHGFPGLSSGLLHTANVSPPMVCGVAPGPKRRDSLGIPNFVNVARCVGGPFAPGKGENIVGHADVAHLTKLYMALTVDAVDRLKSGNLDSSENGTIRINGVEAWGPKAYYFLETQSLPSKKLFGEVFVQALQKYGEVPFEGTNEVKHLSLSELSDHVATRFAGMPGNWDPYIAVIANCFFVNIRSVGTRADKVFGIRPEHGKVDIERDVRQFLGKA